MADVKLGSVTKKRKYSFDQVIIIIVVTISHLSLKLILYFRHQ